jgi:hypothetical protein
MVSRWIARGLICLFLTLGLPVSANAMVGMIYQPQQRDMTLPKSFWLTVFANLRARGFDTLVVQWTQYGDIFSKGDEKLWLQERLQDAVNADLNLVIGLYADPDGFSAVEVPTDLLEPYFLKSGEKSLALAKQWQTLIPADRIKGWYLPLEIDDRRWRSPADQQVLATQLKREVTLLEKYSGKPVYLSAFFTGNSTPTQFAQMVATISEHGGIKIWIQDGRGTGVLLPKETDLYLNRLSDCAATTTSGIVYEIFRQTGPDRAFAAEPLTKDRLTRALKQRAPCKGDSLFFSLRYLYNFGH